MGPYCGTTSPPTFTSLTNKLTLEFTSDVAMEAGGFEAEWTKVPMSANSKVSQTFSISHFLYKCTSSYCVS